jgi:hypothetical protein
MTPLSIPRRFNGPPASGNGGYVAGLLAERLGATAAAVSLRAPPPLDAPLEIRDAPDGGLSLHHAGTLLAEAVAAPLVLDVPPVPDPEEAATAGALGRLRARARTGNPYDRCYGCGIAREDGLRIVPFPVGDDGLVATDWIPDGTLAGPDGVLPAPIVWAALDCPAGIAWSHRLPDAPPMMTARIAASLDAPILAGERHVVVGWPIARDGRKLHAGTAIVAAADGRVLARSVQLWLLPRA